MKRFQCHKVVDACVIDDFVVEPKGGGVYSNSNFYEVPRTFFARGEPALGDYLVRYEPDGYLSWSPKAVFEAGYTELPQPG